MATITAATTTVVRFMTLPLETSDTLFDATCASWFLLLVYFLCEATTFDMAPSIATEASVVTRMAAFAPLAAARKRLTRIPLIAVLGCAIAIIVYGFLAPFAVPQLAHVAIARLAPTTGAWTARVDRIRFEPFAWAFNLDGVQILRVDGTAAASIRLARVDFSWRSVVRARPVLDRLDIRGTTLHATPRAAGDIWSMLKTISAGVHVAALGVEIALPPLELEKAAPSLALHGTDIDFSAGRGTFAAAASDPFGDGSRLQAEIVAEPTEGGASLLGTATLTRGQIALGNWTITAPSAALSINAKLSPTTVAASLSLLRGEIFAVDEGTPDARFELNNGSASALWQSATGLREARASGGFADGGRAELTVARGTGGTPQVNWHLAAVPAIELAPYAQRALSVEPVGGTIDLELSIGSAEGVAHITARDLRLAVNEPSVATAIALLEDAEGAIFLSLPLAAEQPASEQIVEHVAAHVRALAAAPFAALAALVGRNAADITAIEFVPGTAEPTARGWESLAVLAGALNERKRVGLEVEAGEGADLDRAALARLQVMLHVTLATAQADHAPRAAGIDFAWQRAQDVIEEFARERLDARVFEEIRTSFASGAAAPAAAPERVAYYRALFEALVASEPIADTALGRLASFRVRVVEADLGRQGIDGSRVVNDRDSRAFTTNELLAVLPLTVEPEMLVQAAPRE